MLKIQKKCLWILFKMADGFEMLFKFIFLSNLIKSGSKNPDIGAWYRIYLVMQKSIRWRQTRLFSSILPISTYFRVKLVIDRLLFNQLYFRGTMCLGPVSLLSGFFPISEFFSKLIRFLLDSFIIRSDQRGEYSCFGHAELYFQQREKIC